MPFPLNLFALGSAAANGPLSEQDLRGAAPATIQNAGLSELIKGFGVELISVPKLEQRRGLYFQKLNGGYNGPKVLAEGDSWFLYPITLTDVCGHLGADLAVWDEGLPGDTTRQMRDFIDKLVAAVGMRQPDVFMLSGGGNDLLARERLADFLEPGPHANPADYVGERLRSEIVAVMGRYQQIVAAVRAVVPGLPVIVHGYDYAIPRPNGTWLGGPMEKAGVPATQATRNAIVRAIIDEFHAHLKAFTASQAKVTHVDVRGTVGDDGWFDELHPQTPGFGKVAEKFRAAILKIKPLVG